jgi:hypothetical protein
MKSFSQAEIRYITLLLKLSTQKNKRSIVLYPELFKAYLENQKFDCDFILNSQFDIMDKTKFEIDISYYNYDDKNVEKYCYTEIEIKSFLYITLNLLNYLKEESLIYIDTFIRKNRQKYVFYDSLKSIKTKATKTRHFLPGGELKEKLLFYFDIEIFVAPELLELVKRRFKSIEQENFEKTEAYYKKQLDIANRKIGISETSYKRQIHYTIAAIVISLIVSVATIVSNYGINSTNNKLSRDRIEATRIISMQKKTYANILFNKKLENNQQLVHKLINSIGQINQSLKKLYSKNQKDKPISKK